MKSVSLLWPNKNVKDSVGDERNAIEYRLLEQSEEVIGPFPATDEFCSDDDTAHLHQEQFNMDRSYEELVGSKRKVNYKKILLISGAVLLVVAIIVVVVVLVTGGDDDGDSTASVKQPFTLEDVLEGRLTAKRFNGTWVSGNQITFRNTRSDFVVYDVISRELKTLVSTENNLAEGIKFDLSPDQKYLLIAREYQKLFRHSFAAIYDILELATGTVTPLTVNGIQAHLLLAEWNPVTNGIVFVFNKNIFYKSSVAATEIQITVDSDPAIYNGVPDWVYEEEIFASNSALWFSPNGTQIAFIRFDDTPTKLMNIPVYGPPGVIDFQYTKQFSIYYPKPGSPNPNVALFTCDLNTLSRETKTTITQIPVPSELAMTEPIITAVSWASNDTLVAVWMNRVQNACIIQSCTDAQCSEVTTLSSSTGWVELFTPPTFNKDGSEMAIVTSHNQGTAGGFRHLTLIYASGQMQPLTSGKYIVDEISKWDHDTNVIFYMANTEANSESMHLYAIRAASGESPQCLTCDITIDGVPQTYFSVTFSPNEKFMILISQGPSMPTVNLYQWAVENNNVIISLIENWESNSGLKELLNERTFGTVQKEVIELGIDDFTAKALMILPPGIDRSGARKYPMLVDVYGGPDSFSVIDKWSMDWGNFLAANQSIIYTKIDGRGSGLRGDRLLHEIYRKLGTVEIEDQVTTAKKLQERYPFIDADRMGIWGWSYGGYASAMALARNDTVFQCAASVAPVTDWTYYDSIYTERFMGLPTVDDNLVGYENSRLSTLATSFKDKNLFLIHGTLDDNVHFQQAMALSRSLERHDIPFKQMSYPDEDHALGGVRPHLYHSLGHFFSDCFNLEK